MSRKQILEKLTRIELKVSKLHRHLKKWHTQSRTRIIKGIGELADDEDVMEMFTNFGVKLYESLKLNVDLHESAATEELRKRLVDGAYDQTQSLEGLKPYSDYMDEDESEELKSAVYIQTTIPCKPPCVKNNHPLCKLIKRN